MVAPLIIAGLIGAGASLLGGALRNRAQRQQNEIDRARQDDQLQRMMADAGAAGIHPVAALGTSANYGTPVGEAPTGFAEGLEGAGGFLSDAIQAQQDFQINAQALALEGMRLENESKAFQLQEAQSRSILSSLRGGVLDAPAAIVEDPSPALIGGRGFTIGAAGPYTPSRVAEDIYGEPGEWLFGGYNLLRDLGANFREAVHLRFPALAELGWDTPIATIGNPDRSYATYGRFSTTPGVNFETDRLWRLSHP